MQEKFPKAQVDIFITVLENDGNGKCCVLHEVVT